MSELLFECADCPMADPADCMKASHCAHRDGASPLEQRLGQVVLQLANEIHAMEFRDSPWEQELTRTHLAIASTLVRLAEKIDPLVLERGE